MSFDDDLRHRLGAEASRYDPAGDGWDEINAGVRAGRARRRRLQGGALAATVVIVAVAAFGLGVGERTGEGTTDVAAGPVATEAPASGPTTTTAVAPAPDAAGALPGIWPFWSQGQVDDWDGGDARFTDPVATADAFAREYLGMLDPVVGEAMVGEAMGDGSATTQVEVRPRGEDGQPVPDGGPSTVVTLRSLRSAPQAQVWTVTGASSPNIAVDRPMALATIASPVTVSGQATGYEATVVAEVRQDGMVAGSSLGRTVGTAGNFGQLGPLAIEVAFAPPTEPAGAVVVTTDTGLDGVGVPEATVIRVRLGSGGNGIDAGPTPGCEPPSGAGEPGPDEMDVTVYFTCDEVDEVTFVPVSRRIPRSEGVLRATLEQLFLGPTPAERAAGLGSFFRSEADGFQESTADLLAGVTIADGTAVVDLAHTVNNASTSAGSMSFLGELNRTVLHVPGVDRVEYRLDGSCQAFGEWMQSALCQVFTPHEVSYQAQGPPPAERKTCFITDAWSPPGPDEMTVTVYPFCGGELQEWTFDPEAFVPVRRNVPRSNGTLRSSLVALFEVIGPPIPGFDSADALRAVVVDGSTAVVDFDEANLRNVYLSLDDPYMGSVFLGEVTLTATQFSNVSQVEYRLDGSCEDFATAVDLDGCLLFTRDGAAPR